MDPLVGTLIFLAGLAIAPTLLIMFKKWLFSPTRLKPTTKDPYSLADKGTDLSYYHQANRVYNQLEKVKDQRNEPIGEAQQTSSSDTLYKGASQPKVPENRPERIEQPKVTAGASDSQQLPENFEQWYAEHKKAQTIFQQVCLFF
jgi:hypothetical protein